jgi:hypothetical protein
LRCAGARQATDQQPGARAHAGTFVPSDRCAGSSAYHGADHCAGHSALLGRLAGGYAADALVGIVPAIHIVGAKVVKAFSRAGQHHHAGAARHAGAGGNEQGQGER